MVLFALAVVLGILVGVVVNTFTVSSTWNQHTIALMATGLVVGFVVPPWDWGTLLPLLFGIVVGQEIAERLDWRIPGLG